MSKSNVPKILHVDDDRDFLELFNLTFKRKYNITSVEDTREAFKLLETQTFDVIVSDYEIPGMNGLQFLKKLREWDKDIPVILFTGQGSEEIAREAFLSGVSDYFTKEIQALAHWDKLANSIKRAMNLRILKREKHQNQEKFRRTFDDAPIGAAVVDLNYRISQANHKLHEFLGYPPGELVGMTIKDISHPEDYQAEVELKQSLVKGQIQQGELVKRYLSKDRKVIWGSLSVRLIRNREGQPLYFLPMIMNVTDRQESEQALRYSEKLVRDIFHSSPDSITISTVADGKIKYVNQGFIKKTGYSREDAIGKTSVELGLCVIPNDRLRIMEQIKNSGIAPETEVVIRQKNGNLKPCLLSAGTIIMDNERHMVIICRDTSEWKNPRENLREQEGLYKSILEKSPYVISRLDKNLRYLYINRAVEDEAGIPAQKFIGHTHREIGFPAQITKFFDDNLRQVFKTREDLQVDFSLDTPWGLRFFHSRLLPETDESGNVESVMVISRNVTAQINQEKEIQKSQEKFRSLFENAPLGIFHYTPQGKVLAVNQEYAKMFGFESPGEVLEKMHDVGNTIYQVPSMREKLIKKAFDFQGFIESEVPYRRQDGSLFIGKLLFRAARNKDGKITHLEGFVEDITHRKAYLKNQKEQAELLETISNAVISTDIKLNIKSWNRAATEIFQWTPEEAKGSLINDLLKPLIDRKTLEKEIAKLWSQGQWYGEMDLIRKDGSQVTVLASATVKKDRQGRPVGTVMVCNNLSQEKEYEKQLSLSRGMWKSVVNNAINTIITVDKNYRITFANWQPEEIGGEKLIGRQVMETIPPQYREGLKERLDRAFAGGPPENFENRSLKSMENRWYLSRIGPLYEGEKISGAVIISTDITEKKEEEQRLHQLVQNMPVMVDAFDENNRVIVWNAECEKVTGYSADEIINHPNPLKLLYPNEDNRHEIIEIVEKSKFDFRNFEFDVCCKNGETRTILWSNISGQVAIPGWHTWAVGLDVTQRKQMERELREKNQELSEFSYRVSHDLKSPLNLIKGYLEVIWENRDLFDSYYSKITGQADKLLKFIDSTLKLSRVGKVISKEVGPVDTGELIRYCYSIVALKKVPARLEMSSSLPPVTGDRDSLARVFSNLLANSFHYRDQDKKELKINVTGKKSGNKVIIEISDNGQGITPDQLETIFSTGYTTSNSTGNGFGLAIARKIARAHGGNLTACSEGHKKGATFVLTLPEVFPTDG